MRVQGILSTFLDWGQNVFHHWLNLIHQGPAAAAALGFALIVAVSFVPVIPIPVIAAAVGAVLSFPVALLVTWSAACFGALTKYFIERFLLRAHVHRVFARYAGWHTLIRLMDRHGFIAVLTTRLIPVFPSSIVNLAGAVTSVSTTAFVTATLLGKLPTMIAFTLAGNQLHRHTVVTVVLLAVYTVIIALAGWRLRAAIKHRNEEA